MAPHILLAYRLGSFRRCLGFSFSLHRWLGRSPGEVEIFAQFNIHLGTRFKAAGLRVQFHYNQTPGIHFKVDPPEEYRGAILKGIEDGMVARLPNFSSSGSIWIIEIAEHEVDSRQRACYRAGHLVIDQAYSLTETART